MLKLYYAHRPKSECDGLVERLPPWRREVLAPLKNDGARRSSIGAGLLWRRVMEENGLDPFAPVRRLGAGKPVFAQGDIRFSLSHSGEVCLCALSDASVGADVQELRPARLSIARRFCPAERAALEALAPEEQPRALIALWARKEAWVKAVSAERVVALDEYDVTAEGPWRFTDFCIDGCCAAVCGLETAEAAWRIEID